MTAFQRSGPRRKLLVAGLLVLLLAVLASAFFLGAWPVHEEGSDLPAAVIDIEHNDHCHLIVWSCSGMSTIASDWFAGDASITIAQDMTLHVADSADTDAPSEALVLLSTPPPRSA